MFRATKVFPIGACGAGTRAGSGGDPVPWSLAFFVTQTCLNTLDLLHRALGLMDDAGMPLIAAQIASAIETLEREPHCGGLPPLF